MPAGAYDLSDSEGTTGTDDQILVWTGSNIALIGEGRDATILRVKQSGGAVGDDGHILQISGADHVTVSGITFKARAGQTKGHGIRLSNVDESLFEALTFEGEFGYGIAFRCLQGARCTTNGRITYTVFRDLIFDGSKYDAIDMKSDNTTNRGVMISNVIVKSFGVDATSSQDAAAIDIRGKVIANNLFIDRVNDHTTGIRFRATGGTHSSTGGHKSIVSGFIIEGGSSCTADTCVGAKINANDVKLANGYTEDVNIGVHVSDKNALISNVVVRNADTVGFRLTNGAKSARLVNVEAIGGGVGFQVEDRRVSVLNCLAESNTTGVKLTAAATDFKIVSCVLDGNTTQKSVPSPSPSGLEEFGTVNW